MTGWELRPSVTPSLQDRTKLEEILPWPAWEWWVNLYMGRAENICGVELSPVWSYLCVLIILFVFRSVLRKKKPHCLGNNVSSSPICYCVDMLPEVLCMWLPSLVYCFLVRWTPGHFFLSRSNTMGPLEIFYKISHRNCIRFRCALRLHIFGPHYLASRRCNALFWWKVFKNLTFAGLCQRILCS